MLRTFQDMAETLRDVEALDVNEAQPFLVIRINVFLKPAAVCLSLK